MNEIGENDSAAVVREPLGEFNEGDQESGKVDRAGHVRESLLLLLGRRRSEAAIVVVVGEWALCTLLVDDVAVLLGLVAVLGRVLAVDALLDAKGDGGQLGFGRVKAGHTEEEVRR